MLRYRKVCVSVFAAFALVACQGGSGSHTTGAGGSPESTGDPPSTTGADTGGATLPPRTTGTGGIAIDTGGAPGGPTAPVDTHPFGDGRVTNTAPSATRCGSAGSGKAIAMVAAQGTVAVSAGNLLALSPSNLSALGAYADSQGTHELLVISSNGAKLAAVTSESPRVVRVWDTKTRALIATLEGHARDITALAIDSTGTTVATGSGDGSIKVWSASGGAAKRTLTPGGSSVAHIAVEAGYVAEAGLLDFRMFGPSSDTALVSETTAVVDALAFTDGGAALFVASSKAVYIYDTAKGIRSSGNNILSSRNVGLDVRQILPNGTGSATIVSAYINDWTVESFAFPVPSPAPTPSGYKVSTSLKAFAYDGKGSAGIDGDGNLRSVSATGTLGTAVTLPSFPGNSLDVSPNGVSIAQGTAEGPVRVFVASGLALQSTLTGNTSLVNAVRYDHAGSRLFAISVDGTVGVWNPETKAELKSRQVGAAYALEVSPDDSKLAVGIAGGSEKAGLVLILDSSTLETLSTLDMTTPDKFIISARVNTVAFSADGTMLAIGGSYNSAIQLWSLASNTRLWFVERESYAAGFTDLQFVGSKYILGNMVIGQSGSSNALRLYDVASGLEVTGFKFAESTIASARNSVVIAGDLLVGGYENGQMEVWHLPTGKTWFTITNAHTKGVRDLAVQKDGTILSTSPDGYLNCWVMPKP